MKKSNIISLSSQANSDSPIRMVSFHGQEIPILEKDGVPYVAMRPIVEGMGLNWSNQLRTIKDDLVLNSTVVNLTTVGTDGKQREMICLPLTYLNGWLFKINSGRYKKDDPRRDVIIIYQKECYLALYDYWHKGVAINPRAAESVREEQPLTIGFLRKETEEAILVAGIYGLQGNQALLSANMLVRSRYEIDCMALLGITHLDTDDMELHLTPSDIGRELGCSARTVNKLLISQGFQTSFRDAKKRILYEPTEKGMLYAVFKDTAKTHKDGTPIKQLFWKKSIISLLKEGKPKELGE